MIPEKIVKSMARKNPNFKLIENNQWDLGFENDVHFMYFTYMNTHKHINHIMLLATNLDKEIRYEFITQEKEKSDDTIEIIELLNKELLKELGKNPDYAHKEVINELDKEKYIQIIEQDENTFKRMQRHINKKRKEEAEQKEKENEGKEGE